MTAISPDGYFESFRQQFTLPEGVIYLDGNSLGALPTATRGRLKHMVEQEWGQGLIGSWNAADWINLPQRVGDKIAGLIGADDGEVIACDSTSINLFKALVSALALCDPARRVMVSDVDNFPTDLYIAQGLQALLTDRNLELRLVQRTELAAAIDADTAVVMLTEVDYRTGERLDMGAMTNLAHERGALIIWDLAHSAGAFRVSLNACRADFAVGCGYKYLNGGPGAPAFIFAANRHLQRLDAMAAPAPIAGWFAHASPFEFAPKFRVAQGMSRFLVGTPPVLQLAALETALDLWHEVDIEKVRAQSLVLSDIFIAEVERLCGAQLTLATPRQHERRGSQVSFRHTEGYAIMQALIARGVIGDFRAPDILRFGFAPLYVSVSDVRAAAKHLADVLVSREWDQQRYKQRQAVT